MGHRTTRTCLVAAKLAIVALGATAGLSCRPTSPPAMPRVSVERLRHVDTVRLTDWELPVSPSPTTAATRPTDQSADVRQSVSLEIAEVRAAALSGNLDLEVELIRPEIARQAIEEEEGQFDWAVVGGARHNRQRSRSPSGESELQGNSFDLGLRVPLRTGGAVSIRPFISRSDADDDDAAYDAGLRFSLSHPLLRNAGAEVNTHFIRTARYQTRLVEARTKLNAIRILANVDRVYWLLYDARRQLEVRQRQYELAKRQVDQAQKRVAAGDVPRIEITRAESGLASRLEDILVADTTVRRRERDLKRVMNRPDVPPDSDVALLPTTVPNPLELHLSRRQLAEYALGNRMEMLELELQLALDASVIRFERNRTLPLFTLDYTYNFAASGRTAGDAFAGDGDSAGSWSLGVGAEIPLGNRTARARVHRAILERVQRLATREQRRLAIQQEVYDALEQLEQNWRRILAARNEAVLAGRTYEAEQLQFEVGRRTSTDVLDAAARLANAQLREIRALTDYEISQIDLAFAIGDLLGHGRVMLPARRLP